MKIALSILKRYIPVQLNEQEIADAFVQLGFEIEGTEVLGYCGSGPLVVGQVLKKEKHPNSDHLSVCMVDVGQEQPLQIVCGASNFKEGDRVPVALVGAKIGDIIMKKTNMRGFDSCGMMCSASELGLEAGESHGLYILNELNPQVGTPLDTLFADRKDVVFDISITSNRGDCLSYLGLARELSALTGTPLNFPSEQLNIEPSTEDVRIETEACDYYSGYCIENIQVQPSSEDIENFLQKSGLNAINNVVDVTNFVLLEQGQPLHAFDADKVHFPLIIRSAKDGEHLQTLDGVKHALTEGDIVITDAQEILALGGIMGGASSQIMPETKRIFIECAHFSADNIRRTVRRENISSDSSYRFERFVDKSNAQNALDRAVQLLKQSNPNIVIKKFVRVGNAIEPQKQLSLSFEQVKRVLGFEIAPELFTETLEKLGFKLQTSPNSTWIVTVPHHRGDIQQAVDLVEEFLRLWGTDKIPSKRPQVIACDLNDAPEHELRLQHASILSHAGFYECYTDTLEPVEFYQKFLPEEHLSVLTLEKPLSAEHAVLRNSLIPGLLTSLFENKNRGNDTERLFESGRIFKVTRDGKLCELFATAFIFCTSKQKQWMQVPPFNFYEAQHYVQSLITASGMPLTSVQTATACAIPLWQNKYSGKIGLWEQRGFEADLGYLDLAFTQRWSKDDIIFAAECMWLPERIRFKNNTTFQPYFVCPTITKDLALWVPQEMLGEEVRQNIVKALKKLVKNPVQVRDVRLFDLFNEGETSGLKSLAFSIVFESNNGNSLTEEMINPIFNDLQGILEDRHHYQVRKQNL